MSSLFVQVLPATKSCGIRRPSSQYRFMYLVQQVQYYYVTQRPNDHKFHYLQFFPIAYAQFALMEIKQWEVSVCNQRPRQCLKPARADFSVRGLWPSSYSSLSNCRSGSKFSLRQVLHMFQLYIYLITDFSA